VRTGKAMVLVPDVRAWTLYAASQNQSDPTTYNLTKSRQMLENLGFVVVVNTQACRLTTGNTPPYNTYLDQEMVVDQDTLGSPPGSSALPYGSTITLFKGTSNASAPACQHQPPP
jgi:hypothetical protein